MCVPAPKRPLKYGRCKGMERFVIIGAGAAGITAAQTLRELRPDDLITVLSTDERVHSRCML